MHYYQFNIGDYHSHASHLDELEDLAYRRMLDYCYLNEIGLPNTVEEIGRLIRMRTHCERIANVLLEFFYEDENGDWRHKRVEQEIEAYRNKSERAKESARKRWGKGHANAMRTHSEGNANHKPLTINHKLIDRNDLRFAEFAYEKVKGVAPKTKKPDLDKWANTVRLMREVDGLNLKEMAEVFKWANQDTFWKTNILSMDKFRKQYAQLEAKMPKQEEEFRGQGI